MHTLAGTKISSDALTDLVKVADLLYCDGPLLSLFRNAASENFLFYWCDNDNTNNRWLVVKVSDTDIERYLSQDMPLRPLLRSPTQQFLYAVDVNAHGTSEQVTIVAPDTLPADYLPDADAYFVGEPIRVSAGLREERVYIDGQWSFDDLAQFPSLYSAIYSFTYLATQSDQQATFEAFPMRDGFSSMHFFNGLKHKVPPADRSELKAVRYASPGAIVFKLDPDIAQTVRRIYKIYKENEEILWREHDIINKTLRELSLSSEDATTVEIAPGTSDYLTRLGKDFSAGFQHIPYMEVLRLSGDNSLLALKVILAFFRRISTLREYETRGMMKLSTIA